MSYAPDQQGYYGNYGGAYVPEMLFPNVEELQAQYLPIMNDAGFQKEFRDLLRDYVGRPTPLFLAKNLSQHFGAQIYLKREDLCHTGAHKINNTLGQLILARRLGKTRIIAETGAGQHGVSTATACALMGMQCVVYMGAKDIQRQAPNVARMKMLGAKVIPVTSGSHTLKDATNEAIRDWINNPVDTHYIIGSAVGPHPYPDMVARFQGVISEEIKKQLPQLPDYVVACVGGGSNAIGAFYHFIEESTVQLIGVEAAGDGIDTKETAATLTVGTPGILHGSKTYLMQTADGQVEESRCASAGLDYPGIGPSHAHLRETGRAIYGHVTDTEAFAAGLLVTQKEGIIPALESAHALAYLEKMTLKESDLVVVNVSGRGDKDLSVYLENLDLENGVVKLHGR